MNCYSDDTYQHSSTGEVIEDSILISYDDIRVVNGKLVELEYEKDVNNKLRKVIQNDKRMMATTDSIANLLVYRNRKLKKDKKVLGGALVVTLVAFIVALFK